MDLLYAKENAGSLLPPEDNNNDNDQGEEEQEETDEEVLPSYLLDPKTGNQIMTPEEYAMARKVAKKRHAALAQHKVDEKQRRKRREQAAREAFTKSFLASKIPREEPEGHNFNLAPKYFKFNRLKCPSLEEVIR